MNVFVRIFLVNSGYELLFKLFNSLLSNIRNTYIFVYTYIHTYQICMCYGGIRIIQISFMYKSTVVRIHPGFGKKQTSGFKPPNTTERGYLGRHHIVY